MKPRVILMIFIPEISRELLEWSLVALDHSERFLSPQKIERIFRILELELLAMSMDIYNLTIASRVAVDTEGAYRPKEHTSRVRNSRIFAAAFLTAAQSITSKRH